MPQTIYISEATAARRRVSLRLILASDGVSPGTTTQITAGKARLSAHFGASVASTNDIAPVDNTNMPGDWQIELTTAELTSLGVGDHKAYFKEADSLISIGGEFSITPTDIWSQAPTVAAIVAGVHDEPRSSHTTSGTFGEGVASVQGNVTGSVASVAAGGITAATLATDTITAAKVAADVTTEISAGIFASAVETGLTFLQYCRLSASALFGKSNTNGTVYRDFPDTKPRITATVDASGNRTAVTTDAT